jgi:hypothetical protein
VTENTKIYAVPQAIIVHKIPTRVCRKRRNDHRHCARDSVLGCYLSETHHVDVGVNSCTVVLW